MSGGHFDYAQYHIGQIEDEVQRLIDTNNDSSLNEFGDTRGRFYPEEIIDKFRHAIVQLKYAKIYTQRIDWLVSGDDGEDTFLRQLDEEIGEVLDEESNLILVTAKRRKSERKKLLDQNK